MAIILERIEAGDPRGRPISSLGSAGDLVVTIDGMPDSARRTAAPLAAYAGVRRCVTDVSPDPAPHRHVAVIDAEGNGQTTIAAGHFHGVEGGAVLPAPQDPRGHVLEDCGPV